MQELPMQQLLICHGVWHTVPCATVVTRAEARTLFTIIVTFGERVQAAKKTSDVEPSLATSSSRRSANSAGPGWQAVHR